MTNLVESSWKQISEWLRVNASGILEAAQPGALPNQIQELEEDIGTELPSDLKQFLQLVNGAEGDGLFPSRDDFDEMAYCPMPIEEILADWSTQNELLDGGDFADLEAEAGDGVAADWWNRAWIPFASNGGGNFFCVDLAPTKTGSIGQVISHSHDSGERRKLAESLGMFLQELADDLDANRVDYNEDWGLVAEVDDDEE